MLTRFLRLRWRLVAALFIVGMLLRLPMLGAPHLEGDEVIYRSLVAQLEHGRGYTLHHHPLVERGLIDRYQYDRPLFFHPPGGIALFWLADKVFGKSGLALVQFGCFALFFWSIVLLAHGLRITKSDGGLFVLALLSATNPILTHVTTKYWLDAPLLAFATLASALFVWAWASNEERATKSARVGSGKRQRAGRSKSPGRAARSRAQGGEKGATPSQARPMYWALVAGIVLGFASLIKLTAFEIVPGVLLVLVAMARPTPRTFVARALCLLVPALIVQLPWEIWQWVAVGSPFPQWAGRPSETLIRSNGYVAFLTVVRSPWFYVRTTPLVVVTLVPAALLHLIKYLRSRSKASPTDELASGTSQRLATAFLGWILVVVACNVALGFAGYSKLLRYEILLVPASILLPALLLASPGPAEISLWGRVQRALVLCLVVGMLVEAATGIHTAFQVKRALITPLFGL